MEITCDIAGEPLRHFKRKTHQCGGRPTVRKAKLRCHGSRVKGQKELVEG